MCFETHVSKIVSACFFQLRQLKGIRDCLSLDAAKIPVNAFVVSPLDYCNRLFVGLPGKQLNRLQVVLNAAAWLICRDRRYEHITPLLRDHLHWPGSCEQVTFEICVMVYKALHDMAPSSSKIFAFSLRRIRGDRHFVLQQAVNHGANFQPISGSHSH